VVTSRIREQFHLLAAVIEGAADPTIASMRRTPGESSVPSTSSSTSAGKLSLVTARTRQMALLWPDAGQPQSGFHRLQVRSAVFMTLSEDATQ
jgi:hypothetical protein